MPGSQEGPVPIIRIYGVTEKGNSVMAHVHGYAPYLYVPAPANFGLAECAQFRVSGFLRFVYLFKFKVALFSPLFMSVC